jgi:hypothetical protein
MKLSDKRILSAEEGSCVGEGENAPIEDCVVLLIEKSELDCELLLTFGDLKMMIESLGGTVEE